MTIKIANFLCIRERSLETLDFHVNENNTGKYTENIQRVIGLVIFNTRRLDRNVQFVIFVRVISADLQFYLLTDLNDFEYFSHSDFIL